MILLSILDEWAIFAGIALIVGMLFGLRYQATQYMINHPLASPGLVILVWAGWFGFIFWGLFFLLHVLGPIMDLLIQTSRWPETIIMRLVVLAAITFGTILIGMAPGYLIGKQLRKKWDNYCDRRGWW